MLPHTHGPSKEGEKIEHKTLGNKPKSCANHPTPCWANFLSQIRIEHMGWCQIWIWIHSIEMDLDPIHYCALPGSHPLTSLLMCGLAFLCVCVWGWGSSTHGIAYLMESFDANVCHTGIAGHMSLSSIFISSLSYIQQEKCC